MTIWRGAGGGGDATTDSEINLITALANSIIADTATTTAAAASATASELAAQASEDAAAISETNAAISAAAALVSEGAASVSAAAALVSENNAAASALSVNDTNLVHIAGTETITGTKTFSNTIVGSVNGNAATATTSSACSGNAATVTNGVYTSTDQTIGGNKTFSNTILGSISGTTGTFSGNVQMASANGGQLAGLRNKIINGNMGIFQRGAAAVTTSLAYGPFDRWFTASIGNTFSTTQQSFVSGDTLYNTGGAQFFTQCAVTSVASAGNFTVIRQKIEDVRLLAGQTITVSFWAKAATGTPSIGVSVTQSFGSGGSPSTAVPSTGQAQVITTTWTKYSKTFSIPSINGKTIGTDANTSFTQLNIWLDAGSTFNTESGSIGQSSKTVSIAQVQLEIGSVSTPFEFRPIQIETALCQRYYESLPNCGFIGSGYVAGALIGNYIQFSTTKRAVPTLAVGTAVENVNVSSVTLAPTNINGFRYYGAVTVAGDGYITRPVFASSEL